MEMGSDMLFLLGGHDLEMITIREILEEKSIPYVDKNLRWDNACLSRYSEELNLHSDGGMEIYGVELREDIPADNAVRCIMHLDTTGFPGKLHLLPAGTGNQVILYQKVRSI